MIFSYDVEQEATWEYGKIPFVGESEAKIEEMKVDLGAAWMNEIATAIKSVDPEALVTGSICVTWDGNAKTVSFPLVAIDNSMADYVDVHLYPYWMRDVPEYMIYYFCDQYERLSHKKPLICSEFGIAHKYCEQPQDAAEWVKELVQYTRSQYGFQGNLFWTFDCSEQASQTEDWLTGMWSNEAINIALKEIK
jgi:endo-1,4-beta-mannosidase